MGGNSDCCDDTAVAELLVTQGPRLAYLLALLAFIQSAIKKKNSI